MQRSLLMVVSDVAGNGDVTLRTMDDKESNEWASPAYLTLSDPDESYAIGAIHEITVSDPL